MAATSLHFTSSKLPWPCSNAGSRRTVALSHVHLVHRQHLATLKMLLQVYARLDMNVMFFLRSIRAEWRISIKGEIAMAQDKVPQCFPSLDEARIYLWGIQHRLAQLFDSFTWEDLLNYLLHRTKIEREFDNAYLEDGENLLTQLLQWRIAFDRILQEVRGDSCDKRFYGALVLHLDYLATYHCGHVAGAEGRRWSGGSPACCSLYISKLIYIT